MSGRARLLHHAPQLHEAARPRVPIHPLTDRDPGLPLAEAADLTDLHITTSSNGNPAGSGTGAAVLGHPVRTIRWLAELLWRHGKNLRAGEAVLPGAVHATLPVGAGDVVAVTAGGLCSVTVRCPGKEKP